MSCVLQFYQMLQYIFITFSIFLSSMHIMWYYWSGQQIFICQERQEQSQYQAHVKAQLFQFDYFMLSSQVLTWNIKTNINDRNIWNTLAHSAQLE